MLTIIVPTLNEADNIADTLQPLVALRALGIEVIVSDGGSADASLDIARPLVDKIIQTARGRAQQMNAAAALARGDYLLFLHADTQLPSSLYTRYQSWKNKGIEWGFFPICLSGRQWIFRVIEFSMTWRSRLTAVATGDQSVFVKRALFQDMGGFKNIPLMEDIALSKQLRRVSKPLVESIAVKTSSRRWEERGVLRTILLMWQLRLAYFLGASPCCLAKIYYPNSPKLTS